MENQNMFFECEEKITKRIANKVSDNMDVNDLKQEIFIRFSMSLKTLNNTDNLCGYLLKITDNMVNDFYRSKLKTSLNTEIALDRIENYQEESTEEYSLSEISLMYFIDKLPEKYKEALTLTEINGISQKEVALRLNISYTALKSRVQRAREMLKTEILDCCDYKFDVYGNIISCCENTYCC